MNYHESLRQLTKHLRGDEARAREVLRLNGITPGIETHVHGTGKYKNRRVVLPNGDAFDSQGEYRRYLRLVALEADGLIRNLRHHVSFKLEVNDRDIATYVADFVYYVGDTKIVEDFKGFATDIYKIKRKLMYAVHGIWIKQTDTSDL
jgi:Protein of unknown function (DUF1064)